MDTETTIRTIVSAYDAGDMDKVTEMLSDDLCYKINSRPESGPYVADCRGKSDFFAAIGVIRDDWDIRSYKIKDLVVAGNRGAAQIDVVADSRHRDHKLSSHIALFMTVDGGRVTKIVEYHDTRAVSTARTG